MVSLLPLQFGIPGGPELLVILLIAVLLFGANKIPKLARSTGEAMGEFQKGREEVEKELQEMREGATESSDMSEQDTEPAVEAESAESDEEPAEASDETEADDEALDIEDAEAEEETN
jgi:sec-independent protein translocase protein TatA